VLKNYRFVNDLGYEDYSSSRKKIFDSNSNRLDLSMSESRRSFRDTDIAKILKDPRGIIYNYLLTEDLDLIQGIAKLYSLKRKNFVITAGSDGGLSILSRFFVCTKTRVLIPIPSFGRYEYHVKVNGGKVFFYKEGEFPYDFSLKQVAVCANKRKADVVIFANPNNPTGIQKNKREITEFLSIFKGITILDEALICNFSESVGRYIKRYPNLIIVSSFSKLFGLAGLRIGYIIGDPDHLKNIRKLVSPYEVSSFSLALANYAINDLESISIVRNEIANAINTLKSVRNDKIIVTPTSSVLCTIKYLGGKSLYKLLYREGIITIDGKNFRGLEKENAVRVSVYSKKDIMKLVNVLNGI